MSDTILTISLPSSLSLSLPLAHTHILSLSHMLLLNYIDLIYNKSYGYQFFCFLRPCGISETKVLNEKQNLSYMQI